ncbi:Nudix family hydrolase [Marinobacter sp. SS5-14b]|uniref:Nudix family hydrolase n=1 Tax=Marinobacter sp. SS5-14b TaxID=3050456 RepID=UPI0026E0AC83|nr:Nudix family hydrolase [Marinobacter sp. SS5-14b]
MQNTEADQPGAQARKQVHVAVAVIIREGRVLIARRPDHVHQGGLLEFPGGKVEPDETVQQALVREVAEETGLRVPLQSLEPVIGIRHDYGDKQVFLDVWRTSMAEGIPEGKEGQPVDWLLPEALRDEDFPVANRPIIRALNLPDRLLITGAMVTPKDGFSRFAAGVKGRSRGLVVLRAPDLSRQDYRALATAALKTGSENGIGVLLHGQPSLFDEIPGAAGLHLSWREAEGLSGRPVPAGAWLGVSCHDAEQLCHAERLGADYAVLGPVLPTASHPGEPAMGWNVFADLISNAAIPVYALGGLEPGHMAPAKAAGAQGIAGIRFWW